jgi:hypothetical protein
MTIPAVNDRTKTETRRHPDTWKNTRPGDRVTLIERGMGLKAGQKQVVLAEIEVLSNRLEMLGDMTLADVAAEGFGPGSVLGGEHGWTVEVFALFWAKGHGFGTAPDWRTVPCRLIRWRYLATAWVCPTCWGSFSLPLGRACDDHHPEPVWV